MTDFKTIVYGLTESTSGNFSFASSSNAPTDVSFNNGANWSNQTATITPLNTAGVNLLNIGGINYGVAGAVWYFGSDAKFDTLSIQFSSNTDNTTRTATYEYWNGSTWTAMAQSGSSQRVTAVAGSINLQNNSNYVFKLHPDIYNDWATTSVNGGASRYYVRITNIGPANFTSASLQSVTVWDHFSNFGYSNFDKVYTTVDDAAFTDVTLVARSATNGAFTFTANTTNARMYLGLGSNNLAGFRIILSTAGSVGTGVWEYWNGSAWTSLSYEWFGSLSSNDTDLPLMKSTNQCFIIPTGAPSDWATTTVNSVSKYWIRFRVTVNYATSPVFNSLIPLKERTLTRQVYIPETSNRTFQSVFAKLHFYNPVLSSLGRFVIRGRLGSGSYITVDVGNNQAPTGTFTSVGGKFFSTTANDSVFTDETSDASDSGTADITVTNSTNANMYFGFPNDVKWKNSVRTIQISPNTTANADGVVAWEYWNGSAWTAFTPIVYNADVNLNQRIVSNINVQIPLLTDWTANTVNSFTGYFIRRRITTAYTTAAATWNSVTFNLPTVNETQFTNTGENNATSLLVDLTYLFNSQFSGSSQQLNLKVAAETASGVTGDFPIMTGELYITYSADNQSTRIKTVIIPLDSSSSVLTSTLTSIGSNQIPQLSTYLPEASKTIRNFYIVFTGNDIMNTSMATEFVMRLDSDAPRYTWAQFSGGISGNIFKYIFTKDDVDISSTHDIQMALTARNTNIRNWQMYAVVTYEYDASTTTRAMNSIMLPFETSSTFLSQDDVTLPDSIRKDFYIQEPGTIDNERIGCYLSFTDLANPSLRVKEMNEANYTSVQWGTPAVACGGFRYSWRLPSQNLSRGLNTIGVDMYGESKTSSEPSCAYTCGYFLVNYQSDVAATGIESHNKTIMCLTNLASNNIRANRFPNTLSNPFSNWYINDFGIMGEFYQVTNPNTAVTIDCRYVLENVSNTGNTRAVIGTGGGVQDNESLFYDNITSDRNLVKKYPTDVHRTVDVFNGGKWMIDFGYFSVIGGMHTIATCHEIYYNITGSVLGYSGNGAGLTVTFYDNDTSEVLFTTTTVAGGTFTATWYDNTRNIICDVYDPTLNKYAESNFGIAGVANFVCDLRNGGTKASISV